MRALAALATLYGVTSSRRRRQLAATLMLMIFGAASEVLAIGAVVPFLVLISNPDSTMIPEQVRDVLMAAPGGPVGGAALFLALAALLAAALRMSLLWVSQQLVMGWGSELSSRIFGRMLRQPYSAYLYRNGSELLAGFEKVNRVVMATLQPLMQGVIAAALALCIVTLLFVVDPFAAAVTAVAAVLAYGLTFYVTSGRLNANSVLIAREMSARTRVVREALGGIRDVLLDHSQPAFEKKFHRFNKRARQAMVQNAFIGGAPRFLLESSGLIVLAFLAWALSARTGGIVSALPIIGVLGLGAQRLLPLLQQVWFAWSQLSANLQLTEDVADLLSMEVEPTPRGLAPLPFEESIALDRVTFAYADGRRALEDVSFKIERGERVGIAGSTGSGKTTLIDILMGFLEPTEGSVAIDGQQLDNPARHRWRLNIGHVSQTTYLSDDSIEENITFGTQAPADPVCLREAIETAQLTEFVASLPHGAATRVGERGARLSGGQRQRLGIARALYRRAPVLVLDEATSALDEATELQLIAALGRLDETVTMIIVSHRSATLSVCDRIISLDQGRIVSSSDGSSPDASPRPNNSA